MFCPNCGAQNSSRQNYCRFCRLNLQKAAQSLTSQLVFGEEAQRLKTLSAIRRAADFALTVLVGAALIGLIAYLTSAPDFGKSLIKICLASFILLNIARELVAYFQRQERSESEVAEGELETPERFEQRDTNQLLEEKPFQPAAHIIENSTKLLPLENKTRKFE